MTRIKYPCLIAAASMLAGPPALAQETPEGSVASSSVGKVGQRQTFQQAAPGAEPMARIDSRIQNRIQSRILNRIDQSYQGQTDAASSFERASRATESSNRTLRR